MTTVLVLGASALQVPLVTAASAAGARVVTVDNVPTNPAHALADASHDVSTRDVARIVEIARVERADAILSCCSDVALPALAAAVEALDLRGVRRKTLELWHPKSNLRRLQASCGLSHPDFVTGAPSAALVAKARDLGGDLVVKPTDRSGSRGVARVAADEPAGLSRAIDAAAAVGFEGEVIVERFIDGVEYGGDAWIEAGQVRAIFPTDKHMQDAIVRGHALPARLDGSVTDSLAALLGQHCQHAGYREGPINFDVRIDRDGRPIVLELAPRLGGNWIPQLVEWVYGIDLFAAAVASALDRPIALSATRARRGASFVLASGRRSALPAAIPVEDVQRRVRGLERLELDVTTGATLEALRDSGQQVGRALFDLDATSFEEAVRTLEAALEPWIPATGFGEART